MNAAGNTLGVAGLIGLLLALPVSVSAGGKSDLQIFQDRSGLIATVNVAGRRKSQNPFFQRLGINGRTCATCHVANLAMGLTPAHARRVYQATRGNDPLFASIDGANCPDAAPSDRAGHSLLLENGLIRIALPVPANAEFSISVVHDPYGCALQRDASGNLIASVYRRPLPATNLTFLSAVQFDGRATPMPLNGPDTFSSSLKTDLKVQALSAIMGHEQAAVEPSDAQLEQIVQFESGLYTAQFFDVRAGLLNWRGALGGPVPLDGQRYYPGINDSLGQDPEGAAFTPAVMALYGAWTSADNRDDDREDARIERARADIAAGEVLFNSAPLTIRGVRGLNDNAALGSPPAIVGTCSTCHDAPNVGDHSLPLPLDIGTSHSTLPNTEPDPAIAAALAELSMPDLPVFQISGCPNPFNGQPVSFFTTDPARALITGKCSDFNRGKGPILRGLAARAPYFHNGAARDLRQVVNFYNQRFAMALTERQKEQLVAFLNSL